MSRNSSLYAAFICVLCCSGAVALQPTVRAGSISLNSGIKPTAGAITSTTSTTTTTNNDSSRGSTLSKFSPAVVPVSRPNNTGNNNNQSSSSTLDELRQQIADLRAAQLDLERNQLTSSQVETAIENTVKGLDLTTTNTDLKNTLLDIQQQSTSLQTSVTALQNQADSFDDNIETTLDNRLKVRGLISNNNTIPFALKSEISPVALANTIVADQNATNTLADNIKPKESEIKEIIRDELVDQEILKNNGELNVEKKGEVQVTEATVTNALRNSNDFKQMILTEIADNGGYVTTTTLDNKKFLSTDSVAFANLATKDDVIPATIAANIADSTTAQNTLATALSGKVGPDANRVDELITQKLKSKGLVTNDENATRNVLTSAELETTLTNKRYATEDALNPKLIAKSIAESDDAKRELAGQIGTSESDVKAILVNKGLLKDDANNTLNVATESSVTSRLNVLNGGISDEGSLLKRIADSDDLKELLRGPAGKDGTGYNIVGSADNYSVIRTKTCTTTNKGDAWVNLNKDNADDVEGRLYICTCNGTSCTWPALGDGIKIKGEKGDPGEKGDSADSVWKTYCNTNDNLDTIIKPLYGSSKTCDNFTKEEYVALTGGPAEYCIKIATKAPNDNSFVASKGLGKTLDDVLGSGTVSNLKSSGISANAGSKKFVFACTEKYDEIMNPKSAWYAYCTEGTNLTSIIQPLYTSSLVPDCKSFTEEQYNALMGGSKEYCMLIAKNAKTNSDYLVATKGVGKTLEEVFGSGTVNNLKTNGLSASVTLSGQSKKFVFACAEKYDEIMNPKSAWYSYCSEGTNLTSIIQPLYGSSNVPDCKAFTQEQYNALMGGPKAYCLLVAKDVDSSTTNVKANLKKLFGDNIVTTLSSQKVATRVTLNNQEMSFVDACAKKYEEIMAGKSGEGYTYRGTIDNYSELSGKSCDAEHEGDAWYNLEVGDVLLYICACNDAKTSCAFPVKGKGVNFKGESGENGKPASQIYCEAHAPNYPSGTRNYDLIVKLYPQVTSCDRTSFTDDMYAAMIGGAKSYCLSLNADFNSGMDLEKGVGLKMAKIYAEKKNVELSAAKTALGEFKSMNANERLADTRFSILDECIANYNRIMSGDDAEDPWHAYCVAQNDKDTSRTNLEVIIKPLYGNNKTCDNFTSNEYNAIMGGAKAYCLSLAQNATTMDLTSGIGEKLSKTFGAATMTTFKETTSLKDRMTLKTFTGKTAANKDFVSACEERYNEIMNPETAWHAYCVATNEKDNTQTNLTAIIQPLYGTSKTCDNFTSDEYNALLNGAKAYCVLVAQQLQSQTLDAFKATDIGKRLTKTLGTTAISDLKTTGLGATMTLNSKTVKVVDACVEKYNEIMNPETAWHAYCVETDANNVSNLDKIIKPLYGNDKTCDNFTSDEYNAIMGGAKAYCLSLAKDPSVLGDLTSGIGKKLKSALGDKVSDFKSASTVQARISMTGFQKASSSSMKFTDACEEKYNEIMSGADGESAWHAYCVATNEKDSTKTNLTAIIKPLYGNSKTCDNFTSDEYNAIMGGASAYCLLLAQDLSANKLDVTSGIGAKLGSKLTADSGQQTVSALKGQSLTTVLNNKFNGNKTFVKACEEKYNEIMAGDKGETGEDAATIWCKAHTLNTNDTRLTTTSATVRKMSAAKLVTAFKAAGNSDTKLSKAQDASTGAVDGYFTDLQTCIDAVNADPTLMGGESAAETQYNEDVKKEKTESGTTFTLGTSTVTTFENKKNTFGSKMVTTDNIGSKIADNLPNTVMKTTDIDNANSATGLALKNAGFTKTSDLADLGIVTVSGTGSNQTITSNVPTSSTIETMVNNKVNNNSTISGLSTRMTNIENNAVTSSTVESVVNTKISNNSTISGLSTRMTNVENNALTKNNLATELTSNTAQTALANAGFATKSNITNDVKNDVFTLSDFSQLLSSGGLEVDNTGKLKLASTSTNAAAANINAKLTAAKANDASIQTTGLTATSNITTAIASVAASAAGEEINSSEVCYKHEWMYWSNAAKCEKCPDGTYFNEDSMSNNSLPRCICKDETLTFSNDGSCVKGSMGSEKCSGEQGAGMYFSTTSNTCEKCPDGTYFNEESMGNTSLPRCTCKDKSMTFDATSGTCKTASSCALTKTVANPKEGGKCQECPKEFPFLQETGSCACPEGTAFNAYRWACAECGAAGAEYNSETQSCVCPAGSGMTLNQEQWKCTK